jgi:hypothetical protein
MPSWRDRCPLNEGSSPPPGARSTGARQRAVRDSAARAAAGHRRDRSGRREFGTVALAITRAPAGSDAALGKVAGKSDTRRGGFPRMRADDRCAPPSCRVCRGSHMSLATLDAAAPESNRPSVGLPHRTGPEVLCSRRHMPDERSHCGWSTPTCHTVCHGQSHDRILSSGERRLAQARS